MLGDQGFGVEPWIFPPIAGPNLTEAERAFNHAHKIVRMSVENCIGDLKMIFRCLLKERCLHYAPTFASKIFYAVATLYNFRIHHNVRAFTEYEADSEDELMSDDESDIEYDMMMI